MFAHLLDHDVEHWAESFLSTLGETRQRPSLIEGLRAMFGASASQRASGQPKGAAF